MVLSVTHPVTMGLARQSEQHERFFNLLVPPVPPIASSTENSISQEPYPSVRPPRTEEYFVQTVMNMSEETVLWNVFMVGPFW